MHVIWDIKRQKSEFGKSRIRTQVYHVKKITLRTLPSTPLELLLGHCVDKPSHTLVGGVSVNSLHQQGHSDKIMAQDNNPLPLRAKKYCKSIKTLQSMNQTVWTLISWLGSVKCGAIEIVLFFIFPLFNLRVNTWTIVPLASLSRPNGPWHVCCLEQHKYKSERWWIGPRYVDIDSRYRA